MSNTTPTPVQDVVPNPAQPKRTFPTWARYTAVAVGSWTIGAVMLAGAERHPDRRRAPARRHRHGPRRRRRRHDDAGVRGAR